jgi:hypothetical protein
VLQCSAANSRHHHHHAPDNSQKSDEKSLFPVTSILRRIIYP